MKGRASGRPGDWPRLELMKGVTIRIFHTRSAQEISARLPRPAALPFPFWACRLPLGSSYITFLLRLVPHISFFPLAPFSSLDGSIHLLSLPTCAALEKSVLIASSSPR